MRLDYTGRDTILVVDDEKINRLILRSILEHEYAVIEAPGGREALNILFKDKLMPTIVLLDVVMPDINGFEVIDKIKTSNSTKDIPVLFITAKADHEDETRGLTAGAVDYITKPFNQSVVKARIDNQITLARYRRRLDKLVSRREAEVSKTYEQTLEILTTIIEYRNLESGAHVKRTTLLTEAIISQMLSIEKFRTLLLDEKQNVFSLIKASALHDIGKIGIADSILLKPGKLTDEEYDTIKAHTTSGAHIIDTIAATLPDTDMYLKYAKDICYHHHERWDGNGYPLGLSGDDIPLPARIVSVVDVYDALVNARPYKEAFSHNDAVEIITKGRGTQFDPDIVDLLPDVSDVFCNIQERNKD